MRFRNSDEQQGARSPRVKTHVAAAAIAIAMAFAVPARAADGAAADIAKCGKRVADAISTFSDESLKALASCPLTNLKSRRQLDCAVDAKTKRGLDSAKVKLGTEVRKCNSRGLTGLCAAESTTAGDLVAALTEGADSLSAKLAEVSGSVLSTSYAPTCSRPTAPVSTAAYDCGARLMQGVRQVAVDLQQCLFDCQVANLEKAGEACVDPKSGLPIKAKVQKCVDESITDFGKLMGSKCSGDAVLVELGCPAGATHISDLQSSLSLAIAAQAQALNLQIFRSACRGDGGTTPPPVPAVAKVILEPGLQEKTITCGQVIDRAFLGAATGLRFASDLSCAAATTPTNGVVIAASDLDVDLGGQFNLAGPDSGKLRTGVGILVAPGARNVAIHNARQIRRFGVGIQDSGDNTGLVIADLTVIRNTVAGVKISTRGVVVDNVTFDRNKVGIEVGGDDTVIRESTIRRSTPAPGIGAYLRALDSGGDGKAVRATQNTIEGNLIGVVLEGGPHQIEQNDVNTNQGDGIQVAGTGAYVNSNSVKLNTGNGIVVTGTGNRIVSNRSDQNAAAGFDIRGDGNVVSNNGAGTLSDRGNLKQGFLVTGQANAFNTNFAEANLLNGFEIRASTSEFKANRAKGNLGIGFSVRAAGSAVDTNAAESNGGAEYDITAGNTDRGGNRANGRVVGFGAAGAVLE